MKSFFIDTGYNNAFTNMQIDESLLKYSEDIVLRFYQWKPRAVSVGYNQDVEEEIDLDYCKKNNIDIVKRITGGKAVFHDKELTYSFSYPENFLHNDVNESFRQIAGALILGLRNIGINAEVKKVPDKIKTPICFNSSNWYEILVNGKKISGSAQRRYNKRILQHGSILIDFDYETNSRIFKTENENKTLEELKDKVTSIKSQMNVGNNEKIQTNKSDSNFELKRLADALKLGFEEKFDIKFSGAENYQEKIIQ